MPRYTGPVNFVLESIASGRTRSSNRFHVGVTFVGEYYYVTHWWSHIAVGWRNRPTADLLNLNGFNTPTTRNLLSALGFDLSSKKISYGKPFLNEKTGKMNTQHGSILHINGKPMLGPDGEPDYQSWYDSDGNWITRNFNPCCAKG